MRLTARRAAIPGAATAAAAAGDDHHLPEAVRARFRGQTSRAAITTAARSPRSLPRRRGLRHARRHRPDTGVLGKTMRYRLIRSEDRQINRALHTVASADFNEMSAPASTPNAAAPKARPTERSNDASSATSPASSTHDPRARP
jgi:hypothetical protein